MFFPRRKWTVLFWSVTILIIILLVRLWLRRLPRAPALSYLDPRRFVKVAPPENKQACIHPKLDPWEESVAKYFHPAAAINCSDDKDWLYTDEGEIRISKIALSKHGLIRCSITFLRRLNDFETVDNVTLALDSDSDKGLTMVEDFFKAKCKAADGSSYDNLQAGVAHRQDLHQRMRNTTKGLGLDVLMLGFDSISRMAFIRLLPKTYKYFTEEMNGIVLKGYNIVGDGTPQALIPIVTGKTELELPPTLKRLKYKDRVDVYPIVWKDFRRHGYVTAWGEDGPSTGTFHYRMTGFNEQPTDHYLRTFYLTADNEIGKHKRLCLGSKRRTEVMFNWVQDLYKTYSKQSKFVWAFSGDVSHDDNNLVRTADDDAVNTLRFLHSNGYLDNTMLVFMSDHGARFSNLRDTLQGKQEERLPFFGFAFPKWFEKLYPEAFGNLKANVNKLTTPFDIYPTFLDLLNSDYSDASHLKQRSISLFKRIPKSRTCADAGIDSHWCACLSWHPLAVTDEGVYGAAEYAVSHINKLVSIQKHLCAKLKVQNITRTLKNLPERGMLMFKRSQDVDGMVPELSDKTFINAVLFQIWFITTPGNGHFEVTVKYHTSTKTYSMSPEDISRTNMYGDDPKCIYNTHHQLRKYCYCKEHLEKL